MNRMKAQAVTGSRDKVDKYERDGRIGVQHEICGVGIGKINQERKNTRVERSKKENKTGFAVFNRVNNFNKNLFLS